MSHIRKMLDAATRFSDAQTKLTAFQAKKDWSCADDAGDAMREAECDFETALKDYLADISPAPARRPETLIEAMELGL